MSTDTDAQHAGDVASVPWSPTGPKRAGHQVRGCHPCTALRAGMPLQAVLAGLWPQLRRGSPGGSPGGAQPTQLPGPIHKGRAGAACPSVVQGAGREARRTEHSGRLRPSPTRPQAPQIRPPERTRCPAVSLSALPAGGRAEDRKGEGGGSLTPRPQAPRGAASGRRAAHKLTSSVCSPSGQTRGVQATLAPPVAMAGAACVSPAVVALSPQRKGTFPPPPKNRPLASSNLPSRWPFLKFKRLEKLAVLGGCPPFRVQRASPCQRDVPLIPGGAGGGQGDTLPASGCHAALV